MNRHRFDVQRKQLTRILLLALGGVLGGGGLCLTAWGVKAREVGRSERIEATAAHGAAAVAAAIGPDLKPQTRSG